MNRNNLIFFVIPLFYSLGVKAQNQHLIDKAKQIVVARNEVVVRFLRNDIPIENISRMMSIDKVEKDTIQAYVFKNQLDAFLKLNLNFRIVEETLFRSLSSTGSIWEWNKYPTYTQYVSMMDSFKKAYPSLCRIVNVGKTVKGRSILFARITGDSTKYKPCVMYSAAIHGDELGGYVLMLRLIDYLLKNSSNANVKNLIDNLDIWINPLANPDGTYFNGDYSVWSSTRGNANGVDLNRNFKDPVRGENPDNNEYQHETNAMMNIMSQDTFILSANFHAGSEVVNYPWDSKIEMHPDSTFFQKISKEYADTVQKYGRSKYFTNVSSNGYIDGYEWYPVFGGRQDYITYFAGGHEVTIEIDVTKRTPENQLADLWDYNFRSMLNYLTNAIINTDKSRQYWAWPVSNSIASISADEFSIFPNPCDKLLFLKNNSEINKAQIIISNISGEILIREKLENLSKAVDVSKLKPGFYMLMLKNNSCEFRKKIIIKR